MLLGSHTHLHGVKGVSSVLFFDLSTTWCPAKGVQIYYSKWIETINMIESDEIQFFVLATFRNLLSMVCKLRLKAHVPIYN